MSLSLGALLRISLHRSRADLLIVASAGLICLLAATLPAAGAIFGSAVSLAGLYRVIEDASSIPIAARGRTPSCEPSA